MDRADDLLEGMVDMWLEGEEESLLVVHVSLGVVILVLTSIRLIWRRTVGLPPWAPTLSEGERRLAHRVELAMYGIMFLIPITGLGLVFISGETWELRTGTWQAPLDLIDDDALLAAHVLTHLLFLGALATHVGLVLKHQLVDRDRLLRRMV